MRNRKIKTAVLALGFAATLAGCTNTTDPTQRALGGGAIGAAAGAGIGGLAGGTSGAVGGALIGGAVGALGGIATTPHASQSGGSQPSGPYRY